jgi:hypothetical protein
MTFLPWTFILIGNAAAIIGLSMLTANGTSSMGAGASQLQDGTRSRLGKGRRQSVARD